MSEEKEIKYRLKNVENSIVSFEKTLKRRRKSVLRRFPTLFLFLSTFGMVSILYSLEKIIDKSPFLSQNPFTLFFVGTGILLITGALYKKL